MKLYRKFFRMRLSMKDGAFEIQSPVSNGINRAVTYAVCAVSTGVAVWLVLHAGEVLNLKGIIMSKVTFTYPNGRQRAMSARDAKILSRLGRGTYATRDMQALPDAATQVTPVTPASRPPEVQRLASDDRAPPKPRLRKPKTQVEVP